MVTALVVTLLPLGAGIGVKASPAGLPDDQNSANSNAFVNVELPPALGETNQEVYVAKTGHTLGGLMLDYWRATGGAAVFGNPISEPFAAENGYYSQAFERGVFQYRPDVLYTVDPIVRLMPIGQMALTERLGMVGLDGKRSGGGGDPRTGTWGSLASDAVSVQRTVADGGVYVEASGHTISGAFLNWYQGHEGDFYLGNPLSEPTTAGGRPVQYFEGGMLLGGKTIELAPLSRSLISSLDVDTKRVPQNGLPVYNESLFTQAPNPNPVGNQATAIGRKHIEVDISEERLFAYQGDTVIMTSLVSTGIAPNTTEQGRFRVRFKTPLEDMKGFTDSTGEVVGVDDGTNTAPGPGAVASFDVPDVPNVMYFDLDAEALHGAYWHNNFGQPMSHGCVNLPLDVAAFLYGWAPLGTEVVVHE